MKHVGNLVICTKAVAIASYNGTDFHQALKTLPYTRRHIAIHFPA